jgi:bifunctional DNase/RNase
MAHEDDELEAAAKVALGEALNLAAQIAEMQMNEEARVDIYQLLDTVAEYYGVERTEVIIDDDEDGTVIVRYTRDDDDEDDTDDAKKDNELPSYLTLAVDNDKKLH